MRLTTERLQLRPVVAEDWRSIQRIWRDFATSDFAQYDRPNDLSDEAVRARIAKWEERQSMEHMFFAVCLQDTVIGYIALNRREDSYELGYCFDSAYHGRGYASESHRALLKHLQGCGITRFTAGTALKNTPSVALLTALGFRLTDTEQVSFYRDEEGREISFDGGLFTLEMPAEA